MSVPPRSPQLSRPEFFTPKRFTAEVTLIGRPARVEVLTPDLRAVPAHVWGDWGPMYTCHLGPEQRVRFVYRWSDPQASDAVLSFDVAVPTVAVNSPSLYKERERFPFRMEIADAAHGILVHGYMAPDGSEARLEVRKMGMVHPDLLLDRELAAAEVPA